jgi:hypothetical protein
MPSSDTSHEPRATLEIERLARALHTAQPHWGRHRTSFEDHRDGHMEEARAIAAAYAEGERR